MDMKRNRNAKLTPLQQVWLRRAAVLLLLLGSAWLIFSPGSGLLAVWAEKKQEQGLEAETAHLLQENSELQSEIEKMKSDPAHLEEVARRDFGLLKPNERVYDFSGPKQEEKE